MTTFIDRGELPRPSQGASRGSPLGLDCLMSRDGRYVLGPRPHPWRALGSSGPGLAPTFTFCAGGSHPSDGVGFFFFFLLGFLRNKSEAF